MTATMGSQRENRVAAVPLGDLTVMADPPAKMWKALAVIAARLHPAYDECSGFPHGTSFDKCLFLTMVVRDFLVGIGFTDARALGCALFIIAHDRAGETIWSVGCGAPGARNIPGRFNGHAVCVVPSIRLLIDPTVYQAIRPQWAGAVTGMAAIGYHEPWSSQMLYGRPAIAGAEMQLADRSVMIAWADRPELRFKHEADYRDRTERRRYIGAALRRTFGMWRDA